MASNNELTADKLFGVTSQLEKVRREADAMEATLGDGMVRIQNSLLAFVGAADQAGGASSALAQELVKISDWIDENRHLSAAMGDDIARSIATIRELVDDLTSAYETAEKALSDLHDGVNSLIGMLGLAEKGADSFGSAWFDTMRQFRDATAETMLDAVGRISAIPSAGKAAYDAFMEGWASFPDAIGALIIEGVAKVIENVEAMVDGVIQLLNYIPTVDIETRVAGLLSGPIREKMAEQGGDAGSAFVDSYLEKFEENQARVRDGFADLVSGAGDMLGYQTREQRQIIEAYELATEWVGKAKDAVADWFDRTKSDAPSVGRAITTGVTKATQEAERAAKKAAEAFERQRRSLDENAAALQRQIDTLGMSAGATAAVELRAREMARALEIAREAGLNAIPPETLAAIDSAASKVAVLTDRLNALREAEQQRQRVADALSNLQFEASLVGLPAVEQQVARQLHQLKLSYESMDGQRLAGQIRYNESLKETQKELERQHELVRNVASTFLDIFTDTSSDNFFDRILKGLSDIGRQFAELGKNRLMETLFGTGYTSGQPAVGQRTVFPVSVPQSYASAPAPAQATASQAITNQLAADVTKTVSNNLLKSMLYSGRDPSHITGLNAEFAANLTQMVEAAPAAVQASLTINSGFRSVARQAELFEAALQKYGSEAAARKWVAPPGRSQHNSGNAADLGYGNDFAREWVHANAGKYGLAFPLGHENWHIELASARGGASGGIRADVRDGQIDAMRQIAQGAVPGLSPQMSPAASQAMANGWGGFGPTPGQSGGMTGGLGGFLQSPAGQMGIAGITSFAGGMQSGSPAGGALSGALSGFAAGGPVGALIGGAAGLLGGIFGNSKRKREERRQREEMERQQREQAQQQLDASRAQILELEDLILDRASGSLEKERERIASQIKQYQDLAATAKNSAEIQRLAAMQQALGDYMDRLFADVRLTADSIIASMMAGRGLEPEYAQAVANVRETSLSIRNYLADLTAAAGEGAAVIGQAHVAGQTQMLRMISGPEEVSEVYTALDTMYGVAAALGSELQKLGLSAEEAGRAIEDHLRKGVDRLRTDFTRGIADETADAMGFGYLSQIRNLIEQRDEHRADAVSLGADPALIDRWFKVQVQNVVDGTGLLGDALDPLIDLFPELADVLGDSMAQIERTLSRAESDLRAAYNKQRQELDQTISRLGTFSDALAKYRDDIRLDKNLSPLAPFEKFTEAQGELIDLSRSYLDEAKSYYASSEHYFGVFDEVSAILAATEATAREEIDAAKLQLDLLDVQVGALIDINDSVLSVAEAIEAFKAAQLASAEAQRLAFEVYAKAMLPDAVTPPSYAPPEVTVTPPAPAPAPTPAPAAPQLTNRELFNGASWQNYIGRYEEYLGRQIFVPSGMMASDAWYLHVQSQNTPRGLYGMRLGGVVPGYQAGGVVGNGLYDVDSVLARYAGGGHIALAGGEHVTTARGVTPETLPMLDFINANHRLPEIRMPETRPAAGGNQANAALIAEVRALRDEVKGLKAVVGAGAMATVDAVKEGTSATREQVSEAKRRNAA